ncbi:MAG: Radical SAM protein [uncultured bacterium]|nr:MAG: Radical SAM protein [uncultured bacterium]
MIDILLVNPYSGMRKRYGKVFTAGFNVFPFGLACLSSVCKKNGYSTEIIDANVIDEQNEAVLDAVIKLNPFAVGLSATTSSISDAALLAASIKNIQPEIYIIIGGSHISGIPHETMKKYDIFDFGIIGEGEKTLVSLLDSLKNSIIPENLPGFVFRKSGDVVVNKQSNGHINIDEEPFPDFEPFLKWLPRYNVAGYSSYKSPAVALITSRGCVSHCTFCSQSVFGKEYRYYSSQNILKMIKYLINNGVKEIRFYDDNLVFPKERIIELCDLIISENINISWTCNVRPDDVDIEILAKMKKAGCWQIAYGIESANSNILKLLGKPSDLNKIGNVIKWTRDFGIVPYGLFMIGNPLETNESLQQTLKYILSLDLLFLQVTFFTPFPGTSIYKIIDNYGVHEKDWDLHTAWTPVFIPYGFNKTDLIKIRRKFYRKFYFRPKIILNTLKLFRNIRNWKNLLKSLFGFFKI